MLFLNLVLIYWWWSAMRALRRWRLVCNIRQRLRIISAMVGDDIRMIAGNKLFCFMRFDRRWSPTIADIILRRSHASQTSHRRRKALIAVHHHHIWELGLTTTLARFNFHFAKRKWREYAFYSTRGNNAICAAWPSPCRNDRKDVVQYY